MKIRLLILVAVLALAAPAVARADTVTDWNANASNAIFTVAGQAPAGRRPCTWRWCRARCTTP